MAWVPVPRCAEWFASRFEMNGVHVHFSTAKIFQFVLSTVISGCWCLWCYNLMARYKCAHYYKEFFMLYCCIWFKYILLMKSNDIDDLRIMTKCFGFMIPVMMLITFSAKGRDVLFSGAVHILVCDEYWWYMLSIVQSVLCIVQFSICN